ncbi:MAG: NAD(P)H-dependent oxidoreductase [Oscillospiraceae bacterium]|nr:NAD(P)H-dependent oxidoreductase [Oscillospiraceae bacterium]
MKFLILNGSPKKDGLCRSVTREIIRGAADGGAETRELTFEKLQLCKCCGEGWGVCFSEHRCAFGGDGFDEAQAAVREADALCIISPVYWHEVSEPLKAFLDRLRRCENPFYDNVGSLTGKPVLLAAVPGGSGNGSITCLDQLNRFCAHTKAAVFDLLSVNRWNADYKRAAAYAAAKAMAEGRKIGDTV